LPVKGGFTYARWTKVYLTSNTHPDDWYGETVPIAVKGAIRRRISKVEHFSQAFNTL